MNEYHEKVRITKRYPKNSENDPISGKNQNIGRKSERPSNFRSFPCFSEDLATLITYQKYILVFNIFLDIDSKEKERKERIVETFFRF